MSEHCGDAAGYVLGALEPEEAERFREHLGTCAICRDEVAALSPVVDMLPAAAPHHPAPRALKWRVMNEVRPPRPKRRLTWVPRLVPVALAAAAALVIGLVIGGGGTTARRTIVAQVHGLPGATAQLERYGSRAVLHVADMPAAPPGHVYEVWERTGTRLNPTNSLFNPASDGSATASVPGDLHDVNAVLVTAEPQGGSSRPTSAPVIVAQL